MAHTWAPNPDTLAAGLSIGLELVLIIVLSLRGALKGHMIFFIYIVWTALSDFAYVGLTRQHPEQTLTFFIIEMSIDSVLQFLVLTEFTYSALNPLRNSLPKFATVAVPLSLMIVGAVCWPLAGFTVPENLNAQSHLMVLLQQSISFLRVLLFFVLVAFSQFLSIGWRNRELQIATGLGFYSILSLVVSVLHTHQAVGPQYHWLDLVTSFGYLGTLAYWVVCFAQKEPEPRKISPQMVRFLVSIGGTVQADRIALESVTGKKRGK